MGFPLKAQILNVEKSRVDKDTTNVWVGSAGFNLNIFNRDAGSGEPNHFVNLGTNANLGYLSNQHGYILMGQLDYVEVTDDPLIRTGYLHSRTTLWRSRTISYELFGQLQYDISRGLRNRWLTGGGVRWRIKDQPKIKMFLGAGLMYETEKWENPLMEDQFIQPQLLKTTNYFSIHNSVKDHLRLNAIAYFQSGYDPGIEAFRHRLNLTASINVKLTSKLDLRTSFDCQYENRPIFPITQFIYSLSNGLAYNF